MNRLAVPAGGGAVGGLVTAIASWLFVERPHPPVHLPYQGQCVLSEAAEESLKLLQSGQGLNTYLLLRELDLFEPMFPLLCEHFTEDMSSKTEQMLEIVLRSTDKRIESGQRINPAFLFAAIFSALG